MKVDLKWPRGKVCCRIPVPACPTQVTSAVVEMMRPYHITFSFPAVLYAQVGRHRVHVIVPNHMVSRTQVGNRMARAISAVYERSAMRMRRFRRR